MSAITIIDGYIHSIQHGVIEKDRADYVINVLQCIKVDIQLELHDDINDDPSDDWSVEPANDCFCDECGHSWHSYEHESCPACKRRYDEAYEQAGGDGQYAHEIERLKEADDDEDDDTIVDEKRDGLLYSSDNKRDDIYDLWMDSEENKLGQVELGD